MILVVDDDPRNRFILAGILKPRGYEVTQASDGLEALKTFSRLPPDVVITDLRMPNLDGADLAVQIHTNWPMSGVILTSGYFTDKAQKVISAGLADFIYKPIERSLLLTKIQRLELRLAAQKMAFACNGRNQVEFRKDRNGETWHLSTLCNDWPTDDYQAAGVLPVGAELCKECLAKGQSG